MAAGSAGVKGGEKISRVATRNRRRPKETEDLVTRSDPLLADDARDPRGDDDEARTNRSTARKYPRTVSKPSFLSRRAIADKARAAGDDGVRPAPHPGRRLRSGLGRRRLRATDRASRSG